MPGRRLVIAIAATFAVLVPGSVGSAGAGAATSPCGRTTVIPTWNHVIVVAFENQCRRRWR